VGETFARAWSLCEALGCDPLGGEGVAAPAEIDLTIEAALGHAMAPIEALLQRLTANAC